MTTTNGKIVSLANKRTADSQAECSIKGEQPAIVDPGEYELVFKYHKTTYLFGRAPKVAAFFEIVTPGKFNGIVLPRWYNVLNLSSKPRKGGTFDIGWHSELLREYVSVFGAPQRNDRVSLTRYAEAVVVGVVEMVKANSKGRSIPEALRYSVIREIKRRAA